MPPSVEYCKAAEDEPAPMNWNEDRREAERVTGWPEVETEGKAAQVKLAEAVVVPGGEVLQVAVPPTTVYVAWMNSLKSVIGCGVKGVRVAMFSQAHATENPVVV